MFLVKWQDLSEKMVYRRFTEIYEFHVSAQCRGVREGWHTQSQLCLWGRRETRGLAGRCGARSLSPPAHREGAFLKL